MDETPPESDELLRSEAWQATTQGFPAGEFRQAHADSHPNFGPVELLSREEREENQNNQLAKGATPAHGAGNRATFEEPHPMRTCFERDLDRIKHSTPWRRLARKTQVFIFPQDHQRSRMTHAIEVAQIAVAVARALRLNVTLTEAIALAHDCGHGPGGHASEDALSVFLPGGYDHAVWGADVTLLPLNLCEETLDGIRNHSWSRPTPSTPEGEVVSWADRIAYLVHDFDDARRAGIVQDKDLPSQVSQLCGLESRDQINAFVNALLQTSAPHGQLLMDAEHFSALAAFRDFNYEHIYTRLESLQQSAIVITMMRELVNRYIDHPELMEGTEQATTLSPRTDETTRVAVSYVGGMTDSYLGQKVVQLLGWDPQRLPGYIMKGPITESPADSADAFPMFT